MGLKDLKNQYASMPSSPSYVKKRFVGPSKCDAARSRDCIAAPTSTLSTQHLVLASIGENECNGKYFPVFGGYFLQAQGAVSRRNPSKSPPSKFVRISSIANVVTNSIIIANIVAQVSLIVRRFRVCPTTHEPQMPALLCAWLDAM